MIVSYKKNFAFFHNPRTGGTSIRAVLAPYADVDQRISAPHYMPATVRDIIGLEQFKCLYKFSIVRNPWEKLVSNYHYARGNPEHYEFDIMQGMSFSEFVIYFVEKRAKTQHQFLSGEDGELLVDYVGRFESLREDFSHVCQVIGISPVLRHLNSVEHGKYESYYNSDTRALVERYFQKDIALWGYSYRS
ncbi:MAG: hypothetical protein GF334_11120 [Candidatus Altiarchaeales archaeon]|nr:hypothetical protein [Candidatus Altiarchaeales archaeon]